MSLIYRKNNKFWIEEDMIKPQFRKADIINGLYASMYAEFIGATENDKYDKLTTTQKLEKINQFAMSWLKKKGYYNG